MCSFACLVLIPGTLRQRTTFAKRSNSVLQIKGGGKDFLKTHHKCVKLTGCLAASCVCVCVCVCVGVCVWCVCVCVLLYVCVSVYAHVY